MNTEVVLTIDGVPLARFQVNGVAFPTDQHDGVQRVVDIQGRLDGQNPVPILAALRGEKA